MSEELIGELRRRINELQTELGNVKDESIKRRNKLTEAKKDKDGSEARFAELTAERDKAVADLAAVSAERDGFKAKLESSPSEAAQKVQQLESQIRERDHRDAWSAALDGQLQENVPIADVWAKAGYKPDGEIPTPDQIKEQAAKARDAAHWLFRTEGETPNGVPGGTKDAARQPLRVAESQSRGARDTVNGRLTYRKADLRQPGWEARNPSLAEAFKAGTAVCLDAEE